MTNFGSLRRGTRLLSAISAVPLLWTMPASAQDGAAAPEEATVGIQDIVVTAQKRSEDLQKVPATITALGSEALETRQITSVTDLQTQVPSLVVGQYYGTSLITLRGISTGLTSGAEDPSVATHINGVYQPRSRSVDSAMVDLERVEVLSGPQGTLYGRNATGGVVNYILKRPSDSFNGQVTARVANYERYGIEGRVTGPLSENVRVLISGAYDNQNKGYAVNLQPNAPRKRMDRGKYIGGRFALDIGDSAGPNLQFDAIYIDSRTVPVAESFTAPDTQSVVDFLGPQSFQPHVTYSELPAFTRTKYFQTSAAINVPISDNVSVKSISAYQIFKDVMLIDLDSSGVASVPVGPSKIDSKTFTQELNLNVEAFDSRLKSIFGVFYYDDKYVGAGRTPFSVPGFRALFQNYGNLPSSSIAAFTDNTFSVTDRFRLQFGLRYNHDTKEAIQSVMVNGNVTCPIVPAKRSWDAWTPRAGAQFDVDDDIMVYGQWSKGFKAGGFTANSCYNGFDPESIKGPEVGIKTKLADNRVRLNISAYLYDVSNLQVQKVVDVGRFFTLNAASARIYGAEFSLEALLTDRLQFDASGMVQSAKYRDFQNCNEQAFQGACGSFDPRPVGSREVDVSGNWLNRAAPYSLNLGLQYKVDVGGGEILVRGESYFSGKVHFSEFPTAASTQKAYSIQNLYVTYTAPDDNFTVRGFLKNIGDTNYKRSYFFNSAVRLPNGNYGAPFTFGADVTVRF